jgi:hypothetical protein
MRWTVLLVLGLTACGGGSGNGTDYAAAYVANWTATGTFIVGGNSQSLEVLVPIHETSANIIEVQGFCSDTDTYSAGPMADVTAKGFTLRSGSCTFSSLSCPAGTLSFAWTSGSGTLVDDTLSGTIAGNLSCGPQSSNYSVSFTSTAKGSYGGPAVHGGPGLLQALRAASQKAGTR